MKPSPRLLQTSALFIALISIVAVSVVANGQSHLSRQPSAKASICGDPTLPCKTTAVFKPNDLPFRVPKHSVIYETELFYAVVLKSIPANEDDCDLFVAETERLEAQALFPRRKVFTTRCADIENLIYTNLDHKFRIMAIYGGTTLADATRVLRAAKKTGKFPDAYLRRMRTSFNGT